MEYRPGVSRSKGCISRKVSMVLSFVHDYGYEGMLLKSQPKRMRISQLKAASDVLDCIRVVGQAVVLGAAADRPSIWLSLNILLYSHAVKSIEYDIPDPAIELLNCIFKDFSRTTEYGTSNQGYYSDGYSVS